MNAKLQVVVKMIVKYTNIIMNALRFVQKEQKYFEKMNIYANIWTAIFFLIIMKQIASLKYKTDIL